LADHVDGAEEIVVSLKKGLVDKDAEK